MVHLAPRTLFDQFEASVAAHPHKVALCHEDSSFTYQELCDLAARVSASLVGLDLKKGDKVGIWSKNDPLWVAVALGMQSIGLVLVPLNPYLTPSEVGRLIDKSDLKALFVEEEKKGFFRNGYLDPSNYSLIAMKGSSTQLYMSFDGFLDKGRGISSGTVTKMMSEVSPEDPMDLLFTSGTTSEPKGVLCSHKQNLRVFRTWAETVGLCDEDRYLIVSPFFHSFGYKAGWLSGLMMGASCFTIKKFDGEKILDLVEEKNITVLPGAPSFFELLLKDSTYKDYDISSLRLAVTGASSIPRILIEDMYEKLGFTTVLTAYGLTESTGVVSICRQKDPLSKVLETSGRPIDGVEVKCVDPSSFESLAPMKKGEIWVRGYNVMLGYYKSEAETKSAITSDGWLRTGDIGFIDEDGYIKITDRLKDMYIMNGQNVSPAEIEQTLYMMEGVSQAAVVGVPKKPQGEVGHAFIVPRVGVNIDPDDVRSFCKEHLAPYKRPFHVDIVTALPTNGSGKVMKSELRRREICG